MRIADNGDAENAVYIYLSLLRLLRYEVLASPCSSLSQGIEGRSSRPQASFRATMMLYTALDITTQ
jgi:hypothetical protein